MKRYLPFIIVAIVGLGTVAAATALYRVKRPSRQSAAAGPVAANADGGHVRGDAKAVVTLEEFGDFQCPPCARLAEPIEQLEKQYGSRLRVIFRQFPLAMHAHAREAALAAEAAASQDHFWQMHGVLFREQALWSKAANARATFETYAGTIGLDVERFKKDIDGTEGQARIAADQKRAAALGVTTTPTLFVNGRAVEGSALSLNGLRAAIDAALAEKRPR